MALRSAYFMGFDLGGDPNLLLWGDTDGMLSLSTLLRRVASDAENQFPLAKICEPVDAKAVLLRKSSPSLGLIQLTTGFEWILDSETLEGFADLVAELAKPGTSAHQYLEVRNHTQIVVRVSCGEYPDDLRPH
jgi:hypothetical protein